MKRSKLRGKRLLLALLAAAVLIAPGFYSGLETTFYTVESGKLPPAFEGYRIALLADLHCHSFGEGQRPLIDAVKALEPDIIALCGDVIDRNYFSPEAVDDLLEGLEGVAPVYAVAGNHEFDNGDGFAELMELYERRGVVYLEGNPAPLQKDGDNVNIYGPRFVHDKDVWHDFSFRPSEPGDFNILLDHFSNYFDRIRGCGFDLVLSGHTHGGIIRLPLIGGIIGNDGFLPEYDGGVFQNSSCVMVSSRGLGDSRAGALYVPRFYNRRELVCVTLRRAPPA